MTISAREKLIKDLKGKTIRIRDLGSILPGWSQGVSPHLEVLRNETEARLDTYEHFHDVLVIILFHLASYPFSCLAVL